MLNPWYVTGFCDGEAAFTYSRASGSFGLYFSIRQREDNRKILEEIQEFFGGIGLIYAGRYFRVTRVSELEIIISHFDQYPLLSKKRETFNIWKEMVKYKLDNFRKTDYTKMLSLAKALSMSNSRSRAFKVHAK